MSQRRLPLLEDEDPYLKGIMERGQDNSWFARWRRAIENPGANDCPPCGGTGYSSLIPGGGVICAKCGGSGRRRTTKRTELE